MMMYFYAPMRLVVLQLRICKLLGCHFHQTPQYLEVAFQRATGATVGAWSFKEIVMSQSCHSHFNMSVMKFRFSHAMTFHKQF